MKLMASALTVAAAIELALSTNAFAQTYTAIGKESPTVVAPQPAAVTPAPAAGTGVYDSKNILVGIINGSFVRRQIGIEWVNIGYVNQLGFGVINPQFYYTTPNCSGQAYWPTFGIPGQGVIYNSSFTQYQTVATGILVYGGSPYSNINTQSTLAGASITSTGVISGGTCTPYVNNFTVGIVKTTGLTFTPPFVVK